MRRNVFTALSTVLLGAAFFAAASPVAQAQTPTRRQAQPQTAKTAPRSADAPQTATNAGAYARVKNFVDADAVLVARLDLAQLDLDAIDKTFSKFFVDSFAAQGFDATSLKEIRRELNKSVKAFKETAAPLLDGYRQDRGLREVYLIVPRADEPEYFVYAPLAKSKRAAVVELAAPFAPNPPFEVGSGVVFGTKKFDADYFKRFKATPNPKLEAFLAESNATLQIYVGEINVAPAAALVGAFAGNDLAQAFDAALAKAPQETRAAVKAFDDYFIDARLELDVNAFQTNARFDFASADAANKTLLGLTKLADVVVADAEEAFAPTIAEKLFGNQATLDFTSFARFRALQKTEEQKSAASVAEADKYNVVPVARELLRGFFVGSLPKRDGAALTFALEANASVPLVNPISGTLLGASIPKALAANKTAALRRESTRNLEELARSTRKYVANSQNFPVLHTANQEGPLHSWRVHLLPYLGDEGKALHKQIRLDEPWNSEHNRQFHAQTPALYRRPGSDATSETAACVVSCLVAPKSVFQPGVPTAPLQDRGLTLASVSDGLENTILFLERSEPVCWMDPNADLTPEAALAEIAAAADSPIQGVPAVFADGAGRVLDASTSAAELTAFVPYDGRDGAAANRRPARVESYATSEDALAALLKATNDYVQKEAMLPALYSIDQEKKPLHSWRVHLLPYLGESALYAKIRLNEPWDSEYNRQFHAQTPAVYRRAGTRLDETAVDACVVSVVVPPRRGAFIPARKPSETFGEHPATPRLGRPGCLFFFVRNEPFCWMDPNANATGKEFEADLAASDGKVLVAAFDGGFVETIPVPENFRTSELFLLYEHTADPLVSMEIREAAEKAERERQQAEHDAKIAKAKEEAAAKKAERAEVAPNAGKRFDDVLQVPASDDRKATLTAISKATSVFRDAHKETFPALYSVDASGRPLHSWRVHLLPFLGKKAESELYSKIRLDEPWDSEYNRQFHAQTPAVYRRAGSQLDPSETKACVYSCV
ncbi:MAG: DUF1559 domain-containing protein, partial [Thermoguttaceae bacterium]|nr:DUF1559 domain-containing protein [Thermoguttaceae bacterium]